MSKLAVVIAGITDRVVFRRAMPALASGVGQGADSYRLNRAMRRAADLLHRNTVIDDRATVAIVVHVVIIDDCGLVENLRYPFRWGRERARMAIAEMVRGDEDETAGVQPEIKVHSHAPAAIEKSYAGPIHGQRR